MMNCTCVNCLTVLCVGLALSSAGCEWSKSNVKIEGSSQAIVAVCGLDREEYAPDGKTLKSAYLRALNMCHARYVLIPPGTPAPDVKRILSTSDGLLLIGGGDIDPRYFHQAPHKETRIVNAARDETDFVAFDRAQRQNMPILGICRGCQVINVARRGTLHQHLPDITSLPHRMEGHDAVHEVTCENAIAMIHWPRTFLTNSAHHQAIDRLGDNLVVLARSNDGTIEACRDLHMRYLLAVQWHPERVIDQPVHKQIFADFASACRDYHVQRSKPAGRPAARI